MTSCELVLLGHDGQGDDMSRRWWQLLLNAPNKWLLKDRYFLERDKVLVLIQVVLDVLVDRINFLIRFMLLCLLYEIFRGELLFEVVSDPESSH